jgi:hypothetical protein
VVNTTTRYQNIVIDSNNLYWRSVTSCAKQCETIDNTFIYTHVIVDFLTRVKEFISQFGYESSIIYFLFDNPKSKISLRSCIDEHYKSHRMNASIPKQFWDTLALLEMILQSYNNNYRVMRLDYCEADDLLYPLLINKKKEDTMLLISVDMDWSRGLSLSDNVSWFNYDTVFWHKAVFKEKYGFYPEKNKVKFYKTFRGDHSDDIKPSVSNIPTNVVIHIINTYDDINYFLERFNRDSEIPEQWKIKILENRTKIIRNYNLVDFVEVDKSLDELVYICKEDTDELRYWYQLLDLPLEARMIRQEDKKSPFTKAKAKRIKRFELK